MTDKIPELTLEPTAAAAEVPQLTLEPTAPAQPEKPAVEPVKIDDSMLSEAEKKAVEEFSKKIDLMDSGLVLQYGAAAQKNVASFSENALGSVRTKDLGQVGDALSQEGKDLAGLSSFGEAVFDGLLQRGHVQFCAQSRLCEGKGHIDIEVVVPTLEQLVGLDGDDDQQVAVGAAPLPQAALAADGEHLAVVDAGWHLDGASLADPNLAATVALGAGLGDDLAGAVAL